MFQKWKPIIYFRNFAVQQYNKEFPKMEGQLLIFEIT